MDTQTHERVVFGLSPTLRKIYDQITLGPTTSKMLREPLGRTDGMTTELRKLQELGLIREAGKAPRENGIGVAPKQYAAVPAGEVETARAAFSARKPTRKRASASRIEELRSRESGEYAAFYATRRRMVEASRTITKLAPMVDWESAPMEELAQVAEEVADLRDALDVLITRLVLVEADAAISAKIEKLLRTNGRTPHEIETAKRLAAKLKARD